MIVFMGLSLCWPLPSAVFQTCPPRIGRRRRPDTDSANYRYRSPVSRGRLQKWGNKYGIPYIKPRQKVSFIIGMKLNPTVIKFLVKFKKSKTIPL